MKKYIRHSTEGSIKRLQNMARNKFSPEEIRRRAAEDKYRGESGQQILTNLMRDPNTTIGQPDDEGYRNIYYNGELMGYVNYRTGEGNFTNKKIYTIIKRGAKARPDYGHEYDDVADAGEDYADDAWDDYEDNIQDDEEY